MPVNRSLADLNVPVGRSSAGCATELSAYSGDEGAAIRLSGRWHLLGRVMMRVTASIKEVAKRLGRRPQIVC